MGGSLKITLSSHSIEAQHILQSSAESMLESVNTEAAVIGKQFLPLRSPDELAQLLHVELLYPAGTPHRGRAMLAELHLRGIHVSTEYELMILVERLESTP